MKRIKCEGEIMLLHTIEKIMEKANKYFFELADGNYLAGKAIMIENQIVQKREWNLFDWEGKEEFEEIDFSTSPYWLTTDDGEDPEAILDREEILQLIINFYKRG